MTNDTNVIEQIRQWFAAQGNGTVARLNFNYNQYFKMTFVEECLQEMNKVVLRSLAGEPPNQLERLAIMLLLESGYIGE